MLDNNIDWCDVDSDEEYCIPLLPPLPLVDLCFPLGDKEKEEPKMTCSSGTLSETSEPSSSTADTSSSCASSYSTPPTPNSSADSLANMYRKADTILSKITPGYVAVEIRLAEGKFKSKPKNNKRDSDSYWMEMKHPGCSTITNVFSHTQNTTYCDGCSYILCRPTGKLAILTEGSSFRKIAQLHDKRFSAAEVVIRAKDTRPVVEKIHKLKMLLEKKLDKPEVEVYVEKEQSGDRRSKFEEIPLILQGEITSKRVRDWTVFCTGYSHKIYIDRSKGLATSQKPSYVLEIERKLEKAMEEQKAEEKERVEMGRGPFAVFFPCVYLKICE